MVNVPDIEKIKKLVRLTGEQILSISPSSGIQTKEGRGNFATAADLASEKTIIEYIKHNFPGHSILSEETRTRITHPNDCENLWIVDPIDGTNNFRYERAYSAISIAFAQKGEVLFGVAYDPFRKEIFTAQKGNGAYVNGKKLQVNKEKNIETATVATDNCSNHEGTRRNLEILLSISETPWTLLKGAAVLTLCEVAAGRVDLYFHSALKPWDLAAAVLIVREAGGVVKSFLKKPAHFLQSSVVAGNRALVEDFFKKTKV